MTNKERRDLFAAYALQGLLAYEQDVVAENFRAVTKKVADMAFDYADAMMERSKQP